MINIGFIGADPKHLPFLQEIQKTKIFNISLIFSENIDPQLKEFSKENGIPITDKLEDIFLPRYKIKLLVDTTEDSQVMDKILNMKPEAMSVIDINALRLLTESIRQKLQLEKRLLLLQKYETIGTLVSGICHEINNILMIIMGYAQLASSKVPSNVSSYISKIIDSCRRANDLIQQLYIFKSGGKIEKKKVSLIPLVKETIKFAKEALPENIHISLNFSSDLYEVEADLVSLRHALLNVIANSQEAMPNGGKIFVSLYNVRLDEKFQRQYPFVEPGDHVCISIRDTGSGIPKEILNKIFEPFFTTKDLGRGLGLSYTYGIVKQHNGYIFVESELNQGTEVKIYLPAIKRQGVSEQAEESETKGSKGKTVLIVEDEKDLVDVISEFLEGIGYKVLKAYNANDALKIINNEDNINIIITDLILPDSFGPQIVYLVKRKKKDIKAILITGYEQKNKITSELFDLVIHKPVSVKELANKVYKLVGYEAS